MVAFDAIVNGDWNKYRSQFSSNAEMHEWGMHDPVSIGPTAITETIQRSFERVRLTYFDLFTMKNIEVDGLGADEYRWLITGIFFGTYEAESWARKITNLIIRTRQGGVLKTTKLVYCKTNERNKMEQAYSKLPQPVA